MAQVIGISGASRSEQTIYDPTCGSGSLLLKAHDVARGRTGLDLAVYGQEMDNAIAALARMNMILHDCPTAEIWQDNTLASTYCKEKSGNTEGGMRCAFPPYGLIWKDYQHVLWETDEAYT